MMFSFFVVLQMAMVCLATRRLVDETVSNLLNDVDFLDTLYSYTVGTCLCIDTYDDKTFCRYPRPPP